MDITQFLARVLAPDGYIAICSMRPGQQRNYMQTRFFPRAHIAGAGGFARWLTRRDNDVWYGAATYCEVTKTGIDKLGKDILSGSRTQDNVAHIKTLWFDADIKRPGDNKTDSKAFSSWIDLLGWIGKFASATRLPPPNLAVNSGYGGHLYWVLEDPIGRAVWEPYAEAFKAALLAHGAKGDIGLSTDAARILRPPQTLNLKVRSDPRPVEVIDRLSRGDYPNEIIYQALKPYLSSATTVVNNQLAGAPPTVMAVRQAAQVSSSTEAAKANLPERRDRSFAEIAKHCEQVKTSLESHGNGDGYELWYLGFISLAGFCLDGQQWAHEISKGDPRYDPANVETHLQRAKTEHDKKGTGAPTCAFMHDVRPKVCEACPHWGRIATPYTLGVEHGDLPDGYRRHMGRIQHKEISKDGVEQWTDVMVGDVFGATLTRVGTADRKISFTYSRAGARSQVAVLQSCTPVDLMRSQNLFGKQGVTITEYNVRQWSRFVMAWIEKLRDLRIERDNDIPAFGWVVEGEEDRKYQGFSVGGTFYKKDGATEQIPGGDDVLVDWFTPKGSLNKWKAACKLVSDNRPDLQTIISAAFASPLIEFTGQAGVVLSCWSRGSAVGKSSALNIGTAVWASHKALLDFDDTLNSIFYRVGKARVMPAYWDEIKIKKDDEASFVDLLFKIGQGREKARLNSDATLRNSGDWKTIVVCSGNRQLMDYVLKHRHDTNAGAVRLFEFEIAHPEMKHSPDASNTINQVQHNYGHAGRLYAKWIAAHLDETQTLLAGMQRTVQRKLDGLQSERFFIAGIAALLVGATIANGLSLTEFNVAKMYAFLESAFYKLRDQRAVNLPVTSNNAFDIVKVLNDFYSDNSDSAIRCNRFARPGRQGKDPNFRIMQHPRKFVGRLAVQIAVGDRRMRIDKSALDAWCYNKGFSPLDVTTQIFGRWGAVRKRGVLGAGSGYAGGRVEVIDIPLVTPDIENLIDDSDAA